MKQNDSSESGLISGAGQFVRRVMAGLLIIFSVLVMTGCHSSRHVSKGIVWGTGPQTAAEAMHGQKLDKRQKRIVEEAYTWLGVPYKYGGNDKRGVDCSGMALRVYEKAADVKLPRVSREQADFCHNVKPSKVKTGDLVFFATGKDKKRISHVGILVTPQYFIHASTSKGVVVSDMKAPYWEGVFIRYGAVR